MANRSSIDGFVSRQDGRGGRMVRGGMARRPIRPAVSAARPVRGVSHRPTIASAPMSGATTGQYAGPSNNQSSGFQGLGVIDDSILADFDNQQTHAKNGRVRGKRGGRGKPRSARRIWTKRIIIALVVIAIGFAGVFVARALMASSRIFKGDLLGFIQQKELKKDANGRSNILLLGTSEDDPGHEGSYLTDSLMVLSLSQSKKDAYMVSIPRDLYVKYGQACNSGYAGKINEYFNCVNSDWNSDQAEDERQASSRKFFGNIVGMDIQYSVHVNYTVLRDLVKALGGIRVTIESRDPRGQMDGNFDWKCKGGNAYASRATMIRNCPPRGHFIDYPNGPVDLDAEHALYLAQARGSTAVSYGFEQSNFDREKNQQKVLVAIKDKATSAGTLTDFGKVTGIIDALGKNLRTNFETSEIRTLMSLGSSIKSDSIKSISLADATPALLTSKVMGGASSVVPTAGAYDYSQIQAYINKNINATPVSKESAHVVVLNASGIVGAAKREADKLEKLGMVIDEVGNARSRTTDNVVYQIGTDKPETKAKLESIYGVKSSTNTPPVTVGAKTRFVVIVGRPTTGTSSVISD